MVGWALIHGDYFFLIIAPFVLIVWLIAAVILSIYALWKGKHVTFARWGAIGLSILLLVSLDLSPNFWQKVFAERFAG